MTESRLAVVGDNINTEAPSRRTVPTRRGRCRERVPSFAHSSMANAQAGLDEAAVVTETAATNVLLRCRQTSEALFSLPDILSLIWTVAKWATVVTRLLR